MSEDLGQAERDLVKCRLAEIGASLEKRRFETVFPAISKLGCYLHEHEYMTQE